MKQKMVYYRDMFEPEKKILAENKLHREGQLMAKHLTLRYLMTGSGDPHDVCKCKHPRDGGAGYCNNGKCNHKMEMHFGGYY